MGDAYVKWFRTQEYYDSGAWRGTWALDGGGALMNQAVHSVDLLLWFMGPAVEVSAYTATLAHERIEVEDVAVANVKFANGALGVIEASTATWPGELKRIEISGDAGSAILREEDLAVWKFAKETKSRRGHPPEDGQPHANRRRRGRSQGDRPPRPHAPVPGRADRDQERASSRWSTAPKAARPIELILAIYKSAETGKPVKLPLKGDPALKGRAKGKKL